MSASVTLRELVSMDVAKELSMTGRVFKSDEAQRLGLVTRVCDDPVQVYRAYRTASRVPSTSMTNDGTRCRRPCPWRVR